MRKDEAQALGCPTGDHFTKLFGESETLFAVQFEAYGAGAAPWYVRVDSGHVQVVQRRAKPKPEEENLPRLPLHETVSGTVISG